MITVINNNSVACTTNPYPGMSLSEACADFELYTERALNEFQMNILLNEHAYLYANGHELDYVEEEVNFKALKDNFINMMKDFGRRALELLDKLIEWVVEAVNKSGMFVTETMAKLGKGKIDKAVKVLDEVVPDGIEITFKKWVDEKGLKQLAQSGITRPEPPANEPEEFFNDIVVEDRKNIIKAADLKDAVDTIIEKKGKDLINDIKKEKNRITKQNLTFLKNAANMSGDEVEKEISAARAQIKWNHKAIIVYTKLVHQYVSNQAAIINKVLHNKAVINAIKGLDEKARKTARAERAARRDEFVEGVKGKMPRWTRKNVSNDASEEKVEESARFFSVYDD